MEHLSEAGLTRLRYNNKLASLATRTDNIFDT